MINLLSVESKRELRAARHNVTLRQYVFTILILGGLITASYAVGYVMLMNQENASKQQLAQFKPQREQYAKTIEEATTYNDNLTIAKSILENEILFSNFMTTIAKTMPQGVTLVNINLKAEDFAQPCSGKNQAARGNAARMGNEIRQKEADAHGDYQCACPASVECGL
jgi:hypothetical protein